MPRDPKSIGVNGSQRYKNFKFPLIWNDYLDNLGTILNYEQKYWIWKALVFPMTPTQFPDPLAGSCMHEIWDWVKTHQYYDKKTNMDEYSFATEYSSMKQDNSLSACLKYYVTNITDIRTRVVRRSESNYDYNNLTYQDEKAIEKPFITQLIDNYYNRTRYLNSKDKFQSYNNDN